MPHSDLSNTTTQLLILKQISNTVGAYIYSKDLQGNYTFANESVLQLFQTSLDQVLGANDSHFFDHIPDALQLAG